MTKAIILKLVWFLVVSFYGTTTNAEISQLRYRVRRRRLHATAFQTNDQFSQFESNTDGPLSQNEHKVDVFLTPQASNISVRSTSSMPTTSVRLPKARSPTPPPSRAPTVALNSVDESMVPTDFTSMSKESSVNISDLVNSVTNAPTASPSRVSSSSSSPTSTRINGFIPVSKKKKIDSSIASSSPTNSTSNAIEITYSPTPSPMSYQPVSIRPTISEKLSQSPTFSETNNSSAVHGGLASDGRSIDSIKIKKFGLEFAPTTQSILIDNNAIHATEVALGKFLTSQIDDASNVTITAVDAEFIPYSQSQRRRLLRERSNLKEKFGSTIIYYQGEIFLLNSNNSTSGASDDTFFESSDFFNQIETPNISPADINTVFQDPITVETFVKNLKATNNDHLTEVKSVMYAPFYPKQTQLQDAPQHGNYSIEMILLGAVLLAVCSFLSTMAIFLVFKRKRDLTKVGDESPSSSEASCYTSQGKSVDKEKSPSSFDDNSVNTTESMCTVLSSQFRPRRKRQKKLIKTQIKFDSNLSTIQEGDCETEVSCDVASRAREQSPIQHNVCEAATSMSC